MERKHAPATGPQLLKRSTTGRRGLIAHLRPFLPPSILRSPAPMAAQAASQHLGGRMQDVLPGSTLASSADLSQPTPLLVMTRGCPPLCAACWPASTEVLSLYLTAGAWLGRELWRGPRASTSAAAAAANVYLPRPGWWGRPCSVVGSNMTPAAEVGEAQSRFSTRSAFGYANVLVPGGNPWRPWASCPWCRPLHLVVPTVGEP